MTTRLIPVYGSDPESWTEEEREAYDAAFEASLVEDEPAVDVQVKEGQPYSEALRNALRSRSVTAAFNPDLHPRGRDGRWIEVGALVRWLLGDGTTGVGTVTSISGDKIDVDDGDGFRTMRSSNIVATIDTKARLAPLVPSAPINPAVVRYSDAANLLSPDKAAELTGVPVEGNQRGAMKQHIVEDLAHRMMSDPDVVEWASHPEQRASYMMVSANEESLATYRMRWLRQKWNRRNMLDAETNAQWAEFGEFYRDETDLDYPVSDVHVDATGITIWFEPGEAGRVARSSRAPGSPPKKRIVHFDELTPESLAVLGYPSTDQEAYLQYMVQNQLDTWAAHASDSDERALALQLEVADHFGISPEAMWEGIGRTSLPVADSYLGTEVDKYREAFGPYLKGYVQASYDATQDYLARAGFEPDDLISLHRGVHYANGAPDWWLNAEDAGDDLSEWRPVWVDVRGVDADTKEPTGDSFLLPDESLRVEKLGGIYWLADQSGRTSNMMFDSREELLDYIGTPEPDTPPHPQVGDSVLVTELFPSGYPPSSTVPFQVEVIDVLPDGDPPRKGPGFYGRYIEGAGKDNEYVHYYHDDEIISSQLVWEIDRWEADHPREKRKLAKIKGANPLGSFSVSRATAADFARNDYDFDVYEGMYSLVIDADVPVRNIFATAATSVGCLPEEEMVVMGLEGSTVAVSPV